MTMRVAIGGIASESCSFSPLPTRREDFQILEGDALLAQYPFLAAYDDVTFVPLYRARAMPGGPVDAGAYEAFRQAFLGQLCAEGPWDGVYLDMHGALYVQGMEDAEGDWLAAVREVAGPDCLLAASYDLHGNVSERVASHLDLLTAYRTAPHVDGLDTRQRACDLLVDCLRRSIRPHLAFVPLPLLLTGERTTTTSEPGASLYGQIPVVVAREGVMDASILVGYAWADEPRSGASVVALGTDRAAVQLGAVDLARAFWERRHGFQFAVPTGSVDECIAMALQATEHPVFISDAGDNVTGGGVGDVPYVLSRLLAYQVQGATYASIADAAAVARCVEAGVGARVHLSLGGKLDPLHGTPLQVEGRVIALATPEPDNVQAAVQVGGVVAVITAQRTAFTTVAQFEALDVDLLAYDIVVVKLGYLFPELQRAARGSVLAFSPGAIDPLVERLPYRHVRRPIYPLDPDMADPDLLSA
jgi:microcystin degradation protein MlrC